MDMVRGNPDGIGYDPDTPFPPWHTAEQPGPSDNTGSGAALNNEQWAMQFSQHLLGHLVDASRRGLCTVQKFLLEPGTAVTILKIERHGRTRLFGKEVNLAALKDSYAGSPASSAAEWFDDLIDPSWDQPKVRDGVCWSYFPPDRSRYS